MSKCTVHHEGRQVVDVILPFAVDDVFALIYGQSEFINDFHKKCKYYNTSFPDWQTDGDGKQSRTVKFTVPITKPLGPKCSHVTETMTLRDCSKSGELYSIDLITENCGIPYADCFFVTHHHCLSRTANNRTRFSVHLQVKYRKSVFFVIKTLIDKSIWSEFDDLFGSLVAALRNEKRIPVAKTVVRPKKQATNSKRISTQHSSESKPFKVTLSKNIVKLITLHAKIGELQTRITELKTICEKTKQLSNEYDENRRHVQEHFFHLPILDLHSDEETSSDVEDFDETLPIKIMELNLLLAERSVLKAIVSKLKPMRHKRESKFDKPCPLDVKPNQLRNTSGFVWCIIGLLIVEFFIVFFSFNY